MANLHSKAAAAAERSAEEAVDAEAEAHTQHGWAEVQHNEVAEEVVDVEVVEAAGASESPNEDAARQYLAAEPSRIRGEGGADTASEQHSAPEVGAGEE